jgi:hypothetical protein
MAVEDCVQRGNVHFAIRNAWSLMPLALAAPLLITAQSILFFALEPELESA